MIDPSILGFTKDDLDAMDPEEREETCRDTMNRAIDLVEALRTAFPDETRAGSLAAECFTTVFKHLARGTHSDQIVNLVSR